MISEIKCYLIKATSSFLGERKYQKCDITNQLEQSVCDTGIVDGTLDTSKISLLRKDKEPLCPLTRIILEIVDDGEVEKIYRVVDNDVVTNVVKGRNPVYRHSLDLLEPTKILERRDIDNLSFTNYLPCNYGIEERAVEFTVVSEKNSSYWTTIYSAQTGAESKGVASVVYTKDSERFVGPYINIGTGSKSISTNVMLQVNYLRQGPLSYIGPVATEASLESYTVTKPDGTVTQIGKTPTVSEITLDTAGEYVFTQVYTGYFEIQGVSQGGHDYVHAVKKLIFSYTVSWTIIAITDENQAAKERTIAQVIDRILSVGKIRGENQTPEFRLDDNIRQTLNNVVAPEFSTGGTLFEALCQVGNFFNAIPRLIPYERIEEELSSSGEMLTKVDDYSEWNIITFDIISKTGRVFTGNNHSLIDMEYPLESYATEFASNIQNASVTNSKTKFSAMEPYEGGFIAPKTESASFEISDNECIIKTARPIRTVSRLIARRYDIKDDNGNVLPYDVDLSYALVEKSVYDNKKIYEQGGHDAKFNYLYYEEGKPNIYGLTFTYETSNFLQDLSKTESLNHLIDAYKDEDVLPYKGYLKDLAFFVEYTPAIDFKVKQSKSFIDPYAEKSSMYYNQQETDVDVERFGQGIRNALLRSGNVKRSTTNYYKHLKDIPHVGDIHEDGYCVFQVNREIMVGVPIKASIYWSKYYNELDANIGIQRELRQFEVSEKQSIQRDISNLEYCCIDLKLDVSKAEKELEGEDLDKFKSTFNLSGFVCKDNVEFIANSLNNQASVLKPSLIECITSSFNAKGEEIQKRFFLPAIFFTVGNSICVNFSFEDNFSAATYSADVSEFIPEASNKAYDIESWVEYTNEFGRFDKLSFRAISSPSKIYELQEIPPSNNLGSLIWGTAEGGLVEKNISESLLSKMLYKFYDSYIVEANTYIQYALGTNALVVDKDSREKLSITNQLSFVSLNRQIEIYPKLVEGVSYNRGIENFRYVIFNNCQSRLDTFVVGDTREINNVVISSNVEWGYISIDFGVAPTNGAGYGIITDKGELCLYVEKEIAEGQVLDPVYLMFRQKI